MGLPTGTSRFLFFIFSKGWGRGIPFLVLLYRSVFICLSCFSALGSCADCPAQTAASVVMCLFWFPVPPDVFCIFFFSPTASFAFLPFFVPSITLEHSPLPMFFCPWLTFLCFLSPTKVTVYLVALTRLVFGPRRLIPPLSRFLGWWRSFQRVR